VEKAVRQLVDWLILPRWYRELREMLAINQQHHHQMLAKWDAEIAAQKAHSSRKSS
jgi:hypothetical protein